MAKEKAAPKKKAERKADSSFMRRLQPDAALGAIVGTKSLPRTEIVKKLWAYIKKNELQDTQNKRMINADDKLKEVFEGKKQVNMFEMIKLVNKHLQVADVSKDLETAMVTNDPLVGYILATGDGSRERPYKVKSIKEEYDVLKYFEKELSMQGFLPNESLDQMICKDGTVFYFDLSGAMAGRRMTARSGNPVIDGELDKLEKLGPQMESIDQAITEKDSYRGLIICPLCNGPLSDHLYGLWECLHCKKTFNAKDLKRADSGRAWGKIVGIALLIALLVGLLKLFGN